MEELTEKQANILAFITRMIEANGYSPSFGEICNEFRFASSNAAQSHLKYLEQKGYIERSPKIARGIKLVDRTPNLKDAWYIYTGLSNTRPTMDFEAGYRIGKTGKINK